MNRYLILETYFPVIKNEDDHLGVSILKSEACVGYVGFLDDEEHYHLHLARIDDFYHGLLGHIAERMIEKLYGHTGRITCNEIWILPDDKTAIEKFNIEIVGEE